MTKNLLRLLALGFQSAAFIFFNPLYLWLALGCLWISAIASDFEGS